MRGFTIGADPEIFLKAGGKPISAHDLIKGTKKEPHPVDGGAIQVDGLATEFNVEPVSFSDTVAFNDGIVKVMKQLHAAVKESNPSASFMKETSVEFDPEYMASLPDDVLVLGCDPDWNAYTCEKNPTPDGSVNFRATGGHIHLGWTKYMPVDDPEYIEICADIVKVLDLYIGLPCRILDPDDRRRTMYGKAGSFRPKPYGLEYRTPSSIWIHNKSTRMAVAQSIFKVVSALSIHKTSRSLFSALLVTDDQVRQAIDGSFDEAVEICRHTQSILCFPMGMISKAINERAQENVLA